jgi:hypothetical protein
VNQLNLTFEPGLAQRFKDMRECFASCVYSRGLGRVAASIDVAPSNLSQMLSGERNLDPSLIEKYMREFGDTTPALFWAAKHLQCATTRQQQALSQLPGLVDQLNRLMAEAGQA